MEERDLNMAVKVCSLAVILCGGLVVPRAHLVYHDSDPEFELNIDREITIVDRVGNSPLPSTYAFQQHSRLQPFLFIFH